MTSGTTDKIKGRAKETVGAVTNNQRLKNEGRLDQAKGNVKNAANRAVDKVKTGGTSDTIKGRAKEAVGVVTNNQRLKNQGRADQVKGKVKNAVARVIDKVKR